MGQLNEVKGGAKGGIWQDRLFQSLLAVAMSAILIAFSVPSFMAAKSSEETVVKGPGVTGTAMLSDYCPALKGTNGDTAIYFLDSGQPGATVVVFGGVHSNEPAGALSAILLVENAVVKQGRLIVIPHANSSGMRYTACREGTPMKYTIKTPWGERSFIYGDRLTSPLDQYPDPDVYVHYPSGQLQSGFDVRNLDRAFPGRADGLMTEKIAYGITKVVQDEKAAMVIDLHEARPMNPIVNCMIAHENARRVATMAMLDLELFEGLKFNLEPSPKNMHGLSHRELGDHTQALAVLMETSNPAMDWLRGPTTADLIVDGYDPFYAEAAARKLLYVPYPAEGIPLTERVGRHLSGVLALLRSFTELYPDTPVFADGVPNHAEIKAAGIGAFLLRP
ncbi:MAG: Succinylglutamate desuccinylase / Aspartoacylase family protein [Firmicutes bacterium ADurb.Bin153]|nr:MAG: Succinylglutamate desuccinylase / Aspartoacylase family protein [Firmicutes bacterium ADurb.Bin153]